MVGKKVVMAVTGVILVGFVIAHMLGNIKIFIGEEDFNAYAEFLRTMGEPLLPYSALLWTARVILLVSAVLHIVAAVELTLMNRAARLHGLRDQEVDRGDDRFAHHAVERSAPGRLHRLPLAASDAGCRRIQAAAVSSPSRSTTM